MHPSRPTQVEIILLNARSQTQQDQSTCHFLHAKSRFKIIYVSRYVCMCTCVYKTWNWKGNHEKEERDPNRGRKYRIMDYLKGERRKGG